MSFLDDILAATASAPLRSVAVPEWSTTIYWRPLTLAQREEIRRRGGNSSGRLCAVGVMLAALDEQGQRLFGDDLQTLATIEGKLAGDLVARLANRIFGEDGLGKAVAAGTIP